MCLFCVLFFVFDEQGNQKELIFDSKIRRIMLLISIMRWMNHRVFYVVINLIFWYVIGIFKEYNFFKYIVL